MSYIRWIEPEPRPIPFHKASPTWREWLNVRLIALLWAIILLIYGLQWMILGLFVGTAKRDKWHKSMVWEDD